MELFTVKNIAQYHQFAGLPKPLHPLISVVDYAQVKYKKEEQPASFTFGYYIIGLKKNVTSKLFYGQQPYDFDEGVLSFFAPGQVLRFENNPAATGQPTGYLLLIHPDFFWGTNLASAIKNYSFFNYAINEALFLSEKEEQVLLHIIENIQLEYQKDIDKFTQQIIVTQIETLLNYADRFYQRQFITRKITNHAILAKVETYLHNYFTTDIRFTNGLPTVKQIAAAVNLSPVYLSNLLKELTGLTAQQHLHEKLIEKAKEKISTTNLTISEIAYDLGFEHSQSFSKFFKAKTSLAPLAFRASFNHN
jgi:AraC-like DNA-binding protein